MQEKKAVSKRKTGTFAAGSKPQRFRISWLLLLILFLLALVAIAIPGHARENTFLDSGEARWLGVQPEGQTEQPPILLLGVPYALKAGDAETWGGLPASAFVLAAPAYARSNAVDGKQFLMRARLLAGHDHPGRGIRK